MNVEGDSRAFASGKSQVGGHTAVVPPCVGIDWLDGQVAPRGHPLPVRKHLLMMFTQSGEQKIKKSHTMLWQGRMCSAACVDFFLSTYSCTESPIHRQTIFKPLDHRRGFSPPRHTAQVVGLPRVKQHLRTPIDDRVVWGDWTRREQCVRNLTYCIHM